MPASRQRICGRSLLFLPSMRPLPTTHPLIMVHDLTPPLSPRSSIGSADSAVTPVSPHTPLFVDDRSKDVFDGHFTVFKNSSEEWEESKDADYDFSIVTVADPGILISPSSSLLSGIDLLGEIAEPPLPEATKVPTSSRSHQTSQTTVPRNESFFDFPSPPALVPNRKTSFEESRPITGTGSRLVANPLSHPGMAASCECISQPSRTSQSGGVRRWSTLLPTEFHPYNSRASGEVVSSRAVGTSSTRAIERTITHPPERPAAAPTRTPLFTPSHSGPGDGFYGAPSPRHHRPKRQEQSEPLTSFMDMSVTKSALSKSRVHKLFSKISGGLKPRSKRHCS